MHKACRHGQEVQLFTPNIRMWKKCDPSDFDCGMIVRADLLGFSNTTVFGGYRQQLCEVHVNIKLSKECFQHFVETMPRQMQAILGAYQIVSKVTTESRLQKRTVHLNNLPRRHDSGMLTWPM